MGMKRIIYFLLGLTALVLLILLGLYIIPPGQTKYQYHPHEFDAQGKYLDKVGWYQDEDDQWHQITWAASGGMRLNHFANFQLIP